MYLDESQRARVVLDGAQTLRNIHEAHDLLRAALADHPTVEVDCDAVTEFDLSFIQLLLSVKRSADKADKLFGLASPAAGQLRTVLERAGFLPATTDEFSDNAAFWLKRSNAS